MSDVLWQIYKCGLIIADFFIIAASLWYIVKADLFNKTKYAEKFLMQAGLAIILIYAIDLSKDKFADNYFDCVSATTMLAMAYWWMCNIIHFCKNNLTASKSDENIELEKTKSS